MGIDPNTQDRVWSLGTKSAAVINVRREPPDHDELEKLLRVIIGEEVQMKAAKGEHGSLKLLVRDLRRKS